MLIDFVHSNELAFHYIKWQTVKFLFIESLICQNKQVQDQIKLISCFCLCLFTSFTKKQNIIIITSMVCIVVWLLFLANNCNIRSKPTISLAPLKVSKLVPTLKLHIESPMKISEQIPLKLFYGIACLNLWIPK